MLSKIAKEIRKRYAKENCTFQSLADNFNISQTTVGSIIRGQIYADAGGPISTSNMRKVLTNAEVKAIRRSTKTHQAISERFGVSRAHVSRIKAGICRGAVS